MLCPANTSSSSPPLGEAATMRSLQHLNSIFKTYRPEIEMLFQLAIFTPFLTNTMRYSSHKLTRARQYPYPPMILHIITGPLQAARYYTRYIATRTHPGPDAIDLVIFSIFNLSSVLLQTYRSKGQSPITRAGFQAAIIQLCGLFPLAYAWRDPELFRVSVKMISWFAWFRIVERVLPHVKPDLKPMNSMGTKFEWTMMLSAPLMMWESAFPGGVPIYLALVGGLMWVERVLAEVVSSYPKDDIVRYLLVKTGFINFAVLKERTSGSNESVASDDEQMVIEGERKMDDGEKKAEVDGKLEGPAL